MRLLRRKQTCDSCNAFRIMRGDMIVYERECICAGRAFKEGQMFWRPVSGEKVVRKRAHIHQKAKYPVKFPVMRYPAKQEVHV